MRTNMERIRPEASSALSPFLNALLREWDGWEFIDANQTGFLQMEHQEGPDHRILLEQTCKTGLGKPFGFPSFGDVES